MQTHLSLLSQHIELALLIIGNVGDEICVALRQRNRDGSPALTFDAQQYVGEIIAPALQRADDAPFLVNNTALFLIIYDTFVLLFCFCFIDHI